jgi:hypothetical protein
MIGLDGGKRPHARPLPGLGTPIHCAEGRVVRGLDETVGIWKVEP